MLYVKAVTVGGLGGGEDRKLVFSPYANVILGPNGSGKSSILKTLRSAMLGNSSLLKNVRFDWAEVSIATRGGTDVFKYTLNKKDIPDGGAPGDGEDDGSGWRVDPAPGEMESSPPRTLYLPTNRHYVSDNIFVRPLALKGDLLEVSLLNTLNALWTEYFHYLSERRSRLMSQGCLDILKSVFNKKVRRKNGILKNSPSTAYMRVSSYLEKLGIKEGMIPFSTFNEDVKNEVELRRVTNCITSIDENLDKIDGLVETAREHANKMVGPRKRVEIDRDGMRFFSVDDEPLKMHDLSAGEKSALILMFATLQARDGVLMIDDADFFLYHELHQGLLLNMRALNPLAQFIVTTHSCTMGDYVGKGGGVAWL